MKKPTIEEVSQVIHEKGYTYEANEFIDHFESIGWVVGKAKAPMKNWKSAMSTFQINRNRWEKERVADRKELIDETTREGKFWNVMKNTYGTKWTSAQGKTPNGLWAEFVRNSSDPSLRRGLLRMKAEHAEWPPSLLIFESLCLPNESDLGLPTEHEAFRQALNRNGNKHPAVIHTLRQMTDVYRFRNESEEAAIKRFGKHWKDTIRYVDKGGKLPEIEKQIEAPKKIVDKSVALGFLNQIMEMAR